MLFQRNAWYVAALPHEVGRDLISRTILDDPILLYRTEDDMVVALQDRCPHRFAPLSRGKLHGDVVACGYHGLRFDSTGACVLNPQGNGIAPHNRVRSYPVEERYGFVWAWLGDPASADGGDIPDLSYVDAAATATANGYIHADYRYDLLVDNLLDLSHADYLHVGSFMGGVCGRSDTQVREHGNHVSILYTQWEAPAPPSRPDLGPLVDQSFLIDWQPGQVIRFEYRGVPSGGDLATSAVFRFAHIATPETANTTHYFMSLTRDFSIDDRSVGAQMLAGTMAVISTEDGPMLEAVDRRMVGRDLIGMRPVILPSDKGALRVRRVMRRLIDQETAEAVSEAAVLADA